MEQVIKEFTKETAANGMLTGKVELFDGRSFYLHSQYDPVQEAQDWLKAVESQEDTAYIVFGAGLGYHLRALLKSISGKSKIYVIEYVSNERLTELTRHLFRDARWLDDPRIQVICGPNLRMIAGQIAIDMQLQHLKRITLCRHYPTMQIYPGFYQQLEENLVNKVEEIFAFVIRFSLQSGLMFMENSWRNLPYIWSNPGIGQLKGAFAGKTAIVVSAGPSLDKNIQQLAEVGDRAIIIASGSALGALKKHGIRAHFLAVLDPVELMYEELKDDFSAETALLAAYEVFPQIVEKYPGRRFFCRSPHNDILAGLSKYLPPTVPLLVNLSVASMAFEFALFLGVQQVVFVGQDMAFSAHASHASGVKASLPTEGDAHEFCYLPGHDGGTVKSNATFRMMLEYFEARVGMFPERTIINATEGGAFMQGALHMTLQEAIASYVTTSTKVEQLLEKITTKFHPAQGRKLYQELSRISGGLDKLREDTRLRLTHVTGMDREQAGDFRAELDAYIRVLRAAPEFTYLKYFLEPLFAVCAYLEQDGMAEEERRGAYIGLLNQGMETLEAACRYVEAARERIAEMLAGGVVKA